MITKEEIEKGNKIIAEFIGEKLSTNEYLVPIDSELSLPYWVDELNFHSSWDWLMPVVEKIETFTFEDERGNVYAFNVIIEGKTCTIERADSTLKVESFYLRQKADDKKAAIFIACCAFIEWYNDFIKSFNIV